MEAGKIIKRVKLGEVTGTPTLPELHKAELPTSFALEAAETAMCIRLTDDEFRRLLVHAIR
jgi:hypothetical protein